MMAVRYTSDSITGLSGDEKALLADTFAVLNQDLLKYGERLFISFFTDFPDHKNYFVDFKGKTLEELAGNPKLIVHGINVMGALNGIIISLNEPEVLVVYIKKIGYAHGRRNIQMQAFMDLKTCFVKFLRENLGKKYNSQVAEVWGKSFDVVTAIFQSGVQLFQNELLTMIILQIIMMLVGSIISTVDIDLPEMKYLADHLQPEECRRLVAALHYRTYNQPNSLDVAADKVSEDIPCLRLLLHWNSSPGDGEGRGQTHEILFRRLRQIGRDDLADWIGKTVFRELGQDLERSIENPFNEVDNDDIQTFSEKRDINLRDIPANNWTPLDTIAWVVILSLCILTTFIVAKTIINFCKRKTSNNKSAYGGKYKELIISDSESEDKFDIRKKDPALKLMGV